VGFLFGALIVAGGAWAILAEEGKVKVAGMAIGPGDIDTCSGLHVYFYGCGFFAVIDGCGHGGRSFQFSVFSFRLSVHSLAPERLISKSEGQEGFLAPRTPLGMTAWKGRMLPGRSDEAGEERWLLAGLKTGRYMNAIA
jgi:hypothetical protein